MSGRINDFAGRLKAALKQRPRLSLALQWIALIVSVLVLTVALRTAQAPAALLLGPLVVGIMFGVAGARTRLPMPLRSGSQALIGCIVAIALGAAAGPALVAHLPLFLITSVATLALSLTLGGTFTRLGWFSSATAVWGLAPGGSASMVTLAEMHGADPRVTAMMQYLRILFAASSAILVAHFLPGMAPASPTGTVWFPPVTALGLGQTVMLAALGIITAKLTRFRPAVFLVPGVVGAALISGGWIAPEMPPWLAVPAYTVIGLNIGLSFTPETLRACARQLPRIVFAVLTLVILCAATGAALGWAFHLDPLTAYLATTPGGLDAVLIVAAQAHVDVSLVIAAQMFRLLIVLIAGPFAAGLVARIAAR